MTTSLLHAADINLEVYWQLQLVSEKYPYIFSFLSNSALEIHT